MKLTVLIDNNTYIDEYYIGEPALSYYIEDENERLLFDTGYSDAFIRNAQAMNIDLSAISTLILSHGHNDHTGGIKYLMNQYPDCNCKIVAHPDVFKKRIYNELHIGSPLAEKDVKKVMNLHLTKQPVKVSKNIAFLGEIPMMNDFERRHAIGVIEESERYEDYVMDDSAIVHQGKEGLFIITGCSHSGICNIIEYAKEVCNEQKIVGVIGGFHLFKLSERLTRTIDYFQKNGIEELYPCHCVSFKAKAEIHKSIPVHEVGVGLKIEIE